MKVQAKIQKWGNSLGIRISGMLRDVPHFEEGTLVAIDILEEGLNIRKLPSRKKWNLPFTEADLLKGMTPDTAEADLLPTLKEGEY